MTAIAAQVHALEVHIADLFRGHPDAPIFASLPRTQALRGGRLLGEIGDCRAPFPTPESLASLAGATPSTRQSGKVKITAFRWAADKQLRDAVCDFAADSRIANPWAARLYNQARARGHRHPTQSGSSPEPWLHVIWRCWHDHPPYDPSHHRALQTVLHELGSPAEA